ncbi:phospholipase A1-like [Epargyreus clarus]|uniref:phospholipase A1-like n=1 Tax=Epargyreus clarus TaxID=520877 RepID=UPI003C2FF999
MLRPKYYLWLLYTFDLLVSLTQCSQAAYLRYYRSSFQDYKETKIQNPLRLLQWIDLSKPTLIYSFGFNSTPESVRNITEAYIKRNHTNYILVNWESEARNNKLEKVLAHALTAVPNSIKVGKELGISLLQLSCRIDMRTVQLSGHSLGAHVVGYAGSVARDRGVVVGRITALDPSSTKYEGFEHSRGLDRSSAAFVSVWHSDPGNYGTSQALGDVDVWFNCGGTVQPGCKEGDFPAFTTDSTCSHSRTISFFVESINSPNTFIASKASDCQSWTQGNSGDCTRENILYVNDKMDASARGNYYLSTNPQEPYGKGLKGLRPN